MRIISPNKSRQYSPRKRQKKKINWASIALIIYIGLLGYAFLFSGFFKVLEPEILVDDKELQTKITRETEAFLARSFLPFLKNSDNAFLLFILRSSDELKSSLMVQFPEIEDINVQLNPIRNSLKLRVSLRRAYGTDCDKESRCFYFDKDGFIFKASDNGSSPIIKDQISFLQIGQEGLKDRALFLKLKEAKEILKALNIVEIDYFLIPQNTVGEFWIKTKDGFYIYLDKTVDIKTQLLGMKELFNKFDKNKKFEYIDLRVTDRIYYR